MLIFIIIFLQGVAGQPVKRKVIIRIFLSKQKNIFRIISAASVCILSTPEQADNGYKKLVASTVAITNTIAVGYCCYQLYKDYSLPHAYNRLNDNEPRSMDISLKNNTFLSDYSLLSDYSSIFVYYNKISQYNELYSAIKNDQEALKAMQKVTTHDIATHRNTKTDRAKKFVRYARAFSETNDSRIDLHTDYCTLLEQRKPLVQLANLIYTEDSMPYDAVAHQENNPQSLNTQIWQDIENRKNSYEQYLKEVIGIKKPTRWSKRLVRLAHANLEKYRTAQEKLLPEAKLRFSQKK